MAQQRTKKQQAKIVALPQIGRTTEHCVGVQDKLNEFGALGYRLLSVVLNGHNNTESNAVLVATNHKWKYRVISFGMKDPKVLEKAADDLGDEGLMLQQVFSQGANMFATAAVFIRPNGEYVPTEDPQLPDENAAKIRNLEEKIERQIEELKQYRKAGLEQGTWIDGQKVTSDASETSGDFTGTERNHVEDESLQEA